MNNTKLEKLKALIKDGQKEKAIYLINEEILLANIPTGDKAKQNAIKKLGTNDREKFLGYAHIETGVFIVTNGFSAIVLGDAPKLLNQNLKHIDKYGDVVQRTMVRAEENGTNIDSKDITDTIKLKENYTFTHENNTVLFDVKRLKQLYTILQGFTKITSTDVAMVLENAKGEKALLAAMRKRK